MVLKRPYLSGVGTTLEKSDIISIKSFYRYLKGGEIVILDDGTLTTSDMKMLIYHVRPLQIVHIDQVKTNKYPKGGCWERLLLISDYVKNYCVISERIV